MATSGTIGTTVISVAKLIEHAVRRCGLSPASITAETITIANQSLYLLLVGMANRGLNLWCVETNYLGLAEGKATYPLPIGTVDLLSLIHSRPAAIEVSSVTSAITDYTLALAEATRCLRVGVKFNSIASAETVTVSSSADGVTFTPLESFTRADWASQQWFWLPLDPSVEAPYFRVSTVAAIDVSEVFLVSSLFDLPLDMFNRDDYMALPNKQILGNPSTNYYYERHLTPQITLWPVPNDSHNHLTLVRHRQIQDIGRITNEVEVPSRWLEAIIWQFALRLCYELPGVSESRAALVSQMSEKNTLEAEGEETDGARIRLNVMVGGYTR